MGMFAPSECEAVPRVREVPYTMVWIFGGHLQRGESRGRIMRGRFHVSNLHSQTVRRSGIQWDSVSPTASRWTLVTFVRPRIEYGLGLNYTDASIAASIIEDPISIEQVPG